MTGPWPELMPEPVEMILNGHPIEVHAPLDGETRALIASLPGASGGAVILTGYEVAKRVVRGATEAEIMALSVPQLLAILRVATDLVTRMKSPRNTTEQ